MYHIIYQTTNLLNNNIYIGYHYQESNPHECDDYYGSGVKLLRAIKKYGIHNFSRKTLYVFNDQLSALTKEQEIVNEDFVRIRDTYNMVVGGGLPPSHKGKEKSQQHRKRIGEAQKGKVIPTEVREKIKRSLLGRKNGPRSEETKAAIRNSLLGKKHSEERKQKMRDNKPNRSGSNNPMFGKIGKDNPNYGKKRSEESVARIRDAAKKSQVMMTCPHCGHVGSGSGMKRWHMNHCRHILNNE